MIVDSNTSDGRRPVGRVAGSRASLIERLECVKKCVPTRTKHEYKRAKCVQTRQQNQAYFAKPENKLKQQRANRRHPGGDQAAMHHAAALSGFFML
jgi:hypothetical protein